MNLTVFGASGGVGKHFVDLALKEGHSVKAVYRRKPEDGSRQNLETKVAANIASSDFVSDCIQGADAVVSCLGLRRKNPANPWSQLVSPPHFVADFSKALIEATKNGNAPKRVIFVSAAGVGESWGTMALPLKLLFKFSKIGIAYQDLTAAEEEFRKSTLNWLSIRPTTLNNKALSENVKVVETYKAHFQISRADVAWFMLRALKSNLAEASRTLMISN